MRARMGDSRTSKAGSGAPASTCRLHPHLEQGRRAQRAAVSHRGREVLRQVDLVNAHRLQEFQVVIPPGRGHVARDGGARGVSLGVEVDEERPRARGREGGGEAVGGGGLAGATLG